MALIGKDDISYLPTLNALRDFYGLTLNALRDFYELTIDALRDFCGLYWFYELISKPNHRVTLIGEDDTSCSPFLFKILVLSRTLHGLYDFSFIKDPMWVNQLDLI